ncbi:MAG: OmpA family protein [Marinosulfonomonas sp.]|nr:OmpA family protein [Marinosulfonomonas sp.]
MISVGRYICLAVCPALAVLGMVTFSTGAALADSSQKAGEAYVPAIWIDPDGCEHWVMDDGFEGFMTPNVGRDGRPVCHSGKTCASLSADQLFSSSSSKIGASNRSRLVNFFKSADATSFIIAGHTDSRASDRHNLRLSQRRAQAVADVAVSAGVNVYSIRGYGEHEPKASNATAAGRSENRRVEIICVH